MTRGRAGVQADVKPSIWILIFLLTLIHPFYATIGGTQLGVPRAFLLFATLPVMFAYLQGRAGRFVASDAFMVLFVLWTFVSAFVNHGSAMPFNLVVALGIETAIPYFLARILIRSAESMRYFYRCMLWIIVYLMIFAFLESMINRNLLVELYSKIPGVQAFAGTHHEPRLGLHRADSVFDHAILYGLFCSLPFAMAWMGLFPGASKLKRGIWAMISFVGTFFSLSSGALFAIIFQGALMTWDLGLKRVGKRWQIALVLAVAFYMLLAVMIDSPPLLYIINHATLNPASAWNRVNIWNWGTINIANNPIFGLAFGDWVRPHWLKGSVDNYWLLTTMRYGYPGLFFHMMTIGWICVG